MAGAQALRSEADVSQQGDPPVELGMCPIELVHLKLVDHRHIWRTWEVRSLVESKTTVVPFAK